MTVVSMLMPIKRLIIVFETIERIIAKKAAIPRPMSTVTNKISTAAKADKNFFDLNFRNLLIIKLDKLNVTKCETTKVIEKEIW